MVIFLFPHMDTTDIPASVSISLVYFVTPKARSPPLFPPSSHISVPRSRLTHPSITCHLYIISPCHLIRSCCTWRCPHLHIQHLWSESLRLDLLCGAGGLLISDPVLVISAYGKSSTLSAESHQLCTELSRPKPSWHLKPFLNMPEAPGHKISVSR